MTQQQPIYTRSPDLISTDMDGEVVMMSIELGSYFGLEGVGGAIWELMENPVTLNEIVDGILAEFEVDEGDCRTDVQNFVDELVDNGLVVVG